MRYAAAARRRAGAGGAERNERMPYGERSMAKTAGRGRAGLGGLAWVTFFSIYRWAPKKKKNFSILAGLSLAKFKITYPRLGTQPLAQFHTARSLSLYVR